ncbi:hypothetical protein GCM10025768_15050 [Microbacterium pseudoresistens]|uniref:DUF3558 domain-containing protein n=1 Tax=Microbacterium pseudoresistens TaxID=640634 RepID=A0A7Y9ESJ4_9MICO|nr:hypothetical protein [Microbacterium pseudoresistens]NYD53142.1 hypothetical protein [Microbacterium pseudoresistens]
MTGTLLRRRRLAGIGIAAALSAALAACATPAAPDAAGPASEEPPNTPASVADGLCAHADEVAKLITTANLNEVADPSAVPQRVADAVALFDEVEPPDEIAEAWGRVGQLFTMLDEALEGKTITSADDLRTVLPQDDPEAFALVLLVPGQAEIVGLHLQDECGVELGLSTPAVADACSVIDPLQLGSVFPSGAPAGKPVRWPNATVECTWSGDENEVGVVFGPGEALIAETFRDMAPVETVAGDPEVLVYDGALGPLRFRGGRTAVVQKEVAAVLVSVAAGGDRRAEADKAIALAMSAALALGD